jgi:DNA-binding response OmpR family regulator
VSEEAKLILVADDDDDVRELVVFRLERAGYRVVTAADGQEAVEVALERSPDVCVIDVMMPGLDGYQVTKRMRASAALAGVPIVLLTASVQEAAVNRGFEIGASDYIKKPFAPQDLLERIASALSGRSSSTLPGDDRGAKDPRRGRQAGARRA